MSYSPIIAYLAHRAGAGSSGRAGIFFFYFPPLKPRYVLWSGVSYSPKNTVSLMMHAEKDWPMLNTIFLLWYMNVHCYVADNLI